MSDYIFSIQDYQGTEVRLSKKVWEEKILSTSIGHPEVSPYLETAIMLIKHPDIVFKSAKREDSSLFYRLKVNNKHHLVVIIKYLKENNQLIGYISTIYLTRRIYSKGDIIWKKNELITS